MTKSQPPTLRACVQKLQESQVLDAQASERMEGHPLIAAADKDSWHSHLVLGFGAWLSSFFLAACLMAIAHDQGAFWGLGWVLIACGVGVQFLTEKPFWRHGAVGLCLAGQVMILVGGGSSTTFASTQILLVNLILVALSKNQSQKFLSVIFSSIALGTLIQSLEMQWLMNFVAPVLLLLVWQQLKHQATWLLRQTPATFSTVLYAELLAAFGFLIISAGTGSTNFPSARDIYPLPWLSTLFIATVIGAMLRWHCNDHGSKVKEALTRPILIGLAAVFGLTITAPGIAFSLAVMLLGALYFDPRLRVLGVGFLIVFVGAFFYGFSATLLEKSFILMAAGTVCLAGYEYIQKRATL